MTNRAAPTQREAEIAIYVYDYVAGDSDAGGGTRVDIVDRATCQCVISLEPFDAVILSERIAAVANLAAAIAATDG